MARIHIDDEEILYRELATLPLREVVRVSANSTLIEVAQRLQAANVSSALIGDSAREIVTERDLTRALANGMGPDDKVAHIAQHTAAWVTTTSTVSDAARMMFIDEIRHLIVLTPDGAAAGVISMRDLFSILLPEY